MNVSLGMGGCKVARFQSFTGRIVMIDNFGLDTSNSDYGCYILVTVRNGTGVVVNFIVEPDTYFVDQYMMRIGDVIIGFYDGDVPVPLIYPPQYRAVVIAESSMNTVKVDYFNEQLISSDGQLKINIAPATTILLENGQQFTSLLMNRYLIVSYRSSTKSIPAQTTPSEIVVMCT